jgi:hypothetical protein
VICNTFVKISSVVCADKDSTIVLATLLEKALAKEEGGW